jgi:hypothetical protein
MIRKLLLAILVMASSQHLLRAGDEPPCGEVIRVERTATGDPSVNIVRFEVWGNEGESYFVGPIVPEGEIWMIRAAGISTNDDTMSAVQWMMHIYAPWPGHEPRPQLIVPLNIRGQGAGTPTVSIQQERVILMPGEAIDARANGLPSTARMAIRCTAWVFPENYLPYLLGLPKSQSLMSSEELAIEQLKTSKGYK